MKCLYYIIFILSLCLYEDINAQSNEGTEFWFSFMEHRNPNINTKVAMISSRVNTQGVISAPLSGFNQSFSVKANDVTIIELPAYAESIGSEQVNDNGFRIISNDLVSVYIHQYYSSRAEASVVLPITTIGKSYYALSYSGYFSDGQVYPSEMVLVANEDDTNISVNLAANTKGGRLKGTTINVTLQAGQTYQIQGATENDDLSGSFITGDKNYSVFCGNKYSALSCNRFGRDNLLEQAYPLSTWGRQFVSVPFQPGYLDLFRILASESATEVEVFFEDGTIKEYNINEGEFVEYEDTRVSYIEASKPVLVAQYINQMECGNGQTGDPSMLYLNSVFQIRDTVTLYNSTFQNIEENYINIISRASDTIDIFFDGIRLTDLVPFFVLAGKNNEFASATLKVTAGAHTITSAGCGVIAKAYGLGSYESYAYSGGASFAKINASPIPDGGCLNDTVFFNTELNETRFEVNWIFGTGDTVKEHQFYRIYNELGSFETELIVHDLCFDNFDTLSKDLQITLRQSVETDSIGIFCEGDDVQLGATDVEMAEYQWKGPNEYFSEDQFPLLSKTVLSTSGYYEVVGIVSGCATFPAEVYVDIKPIPKPELGPGGVFCPKSIEQTILHPGNFNEYLWSTGDIGSTLQLESEGNYHVTVTDEFGCIATDSVSYTQQCPTQIYIPNIFSPNGDQINDDFGVFGEDIISLKLMVFDRWGNQVYHSISQNEYWNGRIGQKDLTPGVYSWILNLEGYDEEGDIYRTIRKGSVTLVR